MKKILKEVITEIIEKERTSKYENNFEKLTSNFSVMFDELNSNRTDVKKYIDKNKTEKEKGAYVFFYEDKPLYVGISKNIRSRIMQHVNGNSPSTSTFAYKIAKSIIKKNGKEFQGTKNDFFKQHIELIEEIKVSLKNMKIATVEIEDDDELALFEIYCSMQFKTSLNSFETH